MIANLLNYIVWDPDPILAHLGPMTIRYYSTCWMIGLLLGYLLMSKLYKQQGLSDEKFSPLFLYIFFGVLIGGRLGHCIFYQPEYFLTQWDHIIEMFIPMHHMADGSWKFTGYEGLASHGGVFGMFVGIWLYCRNMKVSGWVVLDNMGICSGITATFIRLGNLMNSEIIGKVTDVPWAFIFVREEPYLLPYPSAEPNAHLRGVVRNQARHPLCGAACSRQDCKKGSIPTYPNQPCTTADEHACHQ